MEIFLRIFGAIFGDSLSFAFSMAILGWLSIGILLLFVRATSGRPAGGRLIAITPNGLATLGVLGTFTGILVGLLDFDVNDIDSSVPLLLEGLKIAFTTSIVGISSSIIFRLFRAFLPAPEGNDEVTGAQLYEVLRSIRDDGRDASAKSQELLNGLRTAISSDGDSSLLTQVQKLRTTVQDSQADLIKEFRDFAKHMVENNQKAIVEALEQVIRDFNNNLTEQFGENFKELNSAVFALVEWQERYKGHVDLLEARIEETVKATEHSAESLKQVEEHASRIPESISALGPVLNGLEGQIEMLQSQLEAVADLRGKALEAFPVIEANLDALTSEFAKSVDDAVTRSSKALADSETSQTALEVGYEKLRSGANEAQARFSDAISETMKQMSEQTSKSFEQHGQLIEAGSKEANKAIADSWAENGQKMNSQFSEFDAQMQQELTRCLELLGRQLAAVSQKLVDDYSQSMRNLDASNNAGSGR
jgi:hypothetical protein